MPYKYAALQIHCGIRYTTSYIRQSREPVCVLTITRRVEFNVLHGACYMLYVMCYMLHCVYCISDFGAAYHVTYVICHILCICNAYLIVHVTYYTLVIIRCILSTV